MFQSRIILICQFRYALYKVYETISYLNSSEIAELFDDVKSSGQITDYELRVISRPGFDMDHTEYPIPSFLNATITGSALFILSLMSNSFGLEILL